jgi:hypothetical protein
MRIEYVTDAVPWPKLRCLNCQGSVRQMREHLSGSQGLLLYLCGEPLGWLVFGGAVLLGLVAKAVALLVLAWGVIAPVGALWLYLHRLRRASFLCSMCGHVNGYAEARRAASLLHLQK